MKTKSGNKTIPKFETEDEERAFWDAHDSTDYVDWRRAARVVMPNLKPLRLVGIIFPRECFLIRRTGPAL